MDSPADELAARQHALTEEESAATDLARAGSGPGGWKDVAMSDYMWR